MTANNDWWPRFSESEYERRFQMVRAAMDERGYDALLVYGSSIYFGTEPGAPNIAYLASYAPGLQGYLVLPRQGDPTLLVHVPTHLRNARELSVISDVRAGNNLAGLALERLDELSYDINKVGIVGNFNWAQASIPVEHYHVLANGLPNAELEIATKWYEETRLVKSEEEIAFMEFGATMTDRAHTLLRDQVRPGVSDMALHNEVLRCVHELGGRIPFGHVGSTPMVQPTMRYPSFYPVNRVVQRGDVVLTELSAGHGGYFGKIFGTLMVGRPTPEYRRMFELAAEIHGSIYSRAKAGTVHADIDDVLDGQAPQNGYRSISYISGWSNYNTPPAHTRPAGADRDMVLEKGQCVVAVAYVVHPDHDQMGIWLGDTAVVGEHGLRPLHSYPLTDIDYVTVHA